MCQLLRLHQVLKLKCVCERARVCVCVCVYGGPYGGLLSLSQTFGSDVSSWVKVKHSSHWHESTHRPSALKPFRGSGLFCRTVCHCNVTSVWTVCVYVSVSVVPSTLSLHWSPPTERHVRLSLCFQLAHFRHAGRSKEKMVMLLLSLILKRSVATMVRQENTSTKLSKNLVLPGNSPLQPMEQFWTYFCSATDLITLRGLK